MPVDSDLRKLEEASEAIVELFDAAGKRVYMRSEVEEILASNKEAWRLNRKTPAKTFIEHLLGSGRMRVAEFNFRTRKEVRYIWGDVQPFELAQSLKPNAYLTHRSAMYLNGLTREFPEVIYINQEQALRHKRSGELLQEGIDAAFQRPSRVSKEVAESGGVKVCVVHGQRTDGLGVEEMDCADGNGLRVTSLERTLIDITVRPIYSGCVSEVLRAYRAAKGRLSVGKLVEVLREMNYVYPYHQAVGFYLEHAGACRKSDLRQLREMPIEYDFYLDYNMGETRYSQDWRIHVPKGI
jgi:predicted transcriptional regulator of viral defense system